MAYDFHYDKERYFNFQYDHSRDFIVPFVKDHVKLSGNTRVLEVGSAEAGVLKAFTDLGLKCTGIELSESRVELAKKFMAKEMGKGLIEFYASDVYNIDPNKLESKFDLIILKDVIEHIHDQYQFLAFIRNFLNPGGQIFFTMPPWNMPFGGHQQICRSFLKKVPWFHNLPRPVYGLIMKTFGESKPTRDNLLEVWDTGISIRRFDKIIRRTGYDITKRVMFLINPSYKHKFNLEPRVQNRVVAAIPVFRDFVTTSVYSLIRNGD
nr:class I SAM-dependent methyltransferase [Bacteroidota bacterium]